MNRLLEQLSLPQDASAYTLLVKLMEYGVPLALLKEGEQAVLSYMDAYGPLVKVSAEELKVFLKTVDGPTRVRAALLFLVDDVQLPEKMLRQLEQSLTYEKGVWYENSG